jgi:predicted ATPase
MLIDRTGGTPLFLEETVRALAESGVLVGTAGDYRLNDPIARVDIPTSVQAVLAARIDRLPPRAKSQLQAAAVVGMEVEDALLLKIAALPEEDHYDAIATLQAAGFLYETRQLPDIAYVFKHALTHDVAYNSMLREQKRALHVDVVRAIENVHGERLDEQVERLAFHAVCGGLAEEAIDYLYRAALRAIRHSAHEQAIAHINEGLGLLAPLAETGANLRKELDFRKALGVAMMAARGWGATEVSDAYTRAREICEKLGDDSGLFTALRGQGQFHMIRGELRTARQLGERCVTLAERSEDAGVRLETHHLFWSNSFFMGDYGNAAHHADAGIGQYDKGAHHHLTYVYSGHDPGVCCRAFSGLALWQQGYPERAAARCGEALALAQEVSHPLTLALAYWALSYLHLFRQEPGPAGEWAERGIAICNEYLMPLLLSQAQFQSGWAVARQGELSHGIARMEDGVRRIRETGSEMGLPYFVALLGEAYAAAGDAGLGLRRIDEALATAEQTGAYFGYPEMLRLRGELLLRCDGARLDEAETCLASAIEAARGQQAHMLELRAATSLARVLRERGRAAVARESLAPILGRFTEGLDMQDLLDAKVLLDELA